MTPMRPLAACIVILLVGMGPVRAQSASEWEQSYTDALASGGAITVVDMSALPPPGAYPLLLMPDSIRVEGELDDVGRRILDFRERHPAVADGEHEALVNNAYTFQRSLSGGRQNDTVVVVLGALGRTTVNVSRAFPDDALLRDAMTGESAFVSFGLATFAAHACGIILMEAMD